MVTVAIIALMIVFVALDYGVTYWIAKRTGLYRWAQTQIGPPRRDTRLHVLLHRFGAVGLCVVLVGIPVQAGFVIVAGIIAALTTI